VNEKKEFAVTTLLLICLVLGAGVIGYHGVMTVGATASYFEAKRATAECEQWRDEAMIYRGYFLQGWQKKQCDTYGVTIMAPVLHE